MEKDDLLSVADVAVLLNISRSSVNAAIRAKSLTARQVGRAFVVRRADVETYRRLRGEQLGKAGRTKGINLAKMPKDMAKNA